MRDKYQISHKHKQNNIGNLRFSRGFTLIELLAVTMATATVGVMIVIIFFSGLRGANKSNSLTLVRQNGTYLISQMAKEIRFARGLEDISVCAVGSSAVPTSQASMTFITTADEYITYACQSATQTLSSNNTSLLDASLYAVSNCSLSCTRPSVFDPPTIKIQFTLSKKTNNSLPENQSSLPFSTTIFLWNWQR